MPSHEISIIIGISGIFVAIFTFFLGRHLGKKEAKGFVHDVTEQIVKMFNIKYLLDSEDNKALHYVRKTEKIIGLKTESHVVTGKVTITDPKTEEKITAEKEKQNKEPTDK